MRSILYSHLEHDFLIIKCDDKQQLILYKIIFLKNITAKNSPNWPKKVKKNKKIN